MPTEHGAGCRGWVAVICVCAVGMFGMAPAWALAQSGSPDARLTVGNASTRQRAGVIFDASKSTSSDPVVSYRFDYGDGTSATTYQPLAMHAYRRVGAYDAQVVVTDVRGRTAASASVRLVVRDGIPPAVRIDRPRPNRIVHLGGRGRLFSGRANDASGVRGVELAMSLLSARGASARSGAAKCGWYDGRRSLRVRSCSSPLFFAARVSRGRWRFTMPPGARIPAGVYSLRVRALDRAGNRSSLLSLRLRTIIGVRVTA